MTKNQTKSVLPTSSRSLGFRLSLRKNSTLLLLRYALELPKVRDFVGSWRRNRKGLELSDQANDLLRISGLGRLSGFWVRPS